MKRKTFDCVEMKRRGALRIHQETGHLSFEQKLAYWQKHTEALQRLQERAKEKPRA